LRPTQDRRCSRTLVAFCWGVSLAVGCLTLVMVGQMAGASWFVLVRRPVEAAAATLPLFAVLLLPIALRPDLLYPWASSRVLETLDAHGLALLERKRAFLNVGFFAARAAIYALVWSFLATALWRLSTRGKGIASRHTQRALSYGAFPLVALTASFAGFDWIMSLEPSWFSSIFGAYFWCGGFVAALALAIVAAHAWDGRGHFVGRAGAFALPRARQAAAHVRDLLGLSAVLARNHHLDRGRADRGALVPSSARAAGGSGSSLRSVSGISRCPSWRFSPGG